jgi:hypothetical protein
VLVGLGKGVVVTRRTDSTVVHRHPTARAAVMATNPAPPLLLLLLGTPWTAWSTIRLQGLLPLRLPQPQNLRSTAVLQRIPRHPMVSPSTLLLIPQRLPPPTCLLHPHQRTHPMLFRSSLLQMLVRIAPKIYIPPLPRQMHLSVQNPCLLAQQVLYLPKTQTKHQQTHLVQREHIHPALPLEILPHSQVPILNADLRLAVHQPQQTSGTFPMRREALEEFLALPAHLLPGASTCNHPPLLRLPPLRLGAYLVLLVQQLLKASTWLPRRPPPPPPILPLLPPSLRLEAYLIPPTHQLLKASPWLPTPPPCRCQHSLNPRPLLRHFDQVQRRIYALPLHPLPN